MNNKVYQACYTRVGHSGIKDVVSAVPVSEGYQMIHCSDDLPGVVVKSFDERRKTVLPTGAKFSKRAGRSFFCDNNVWGVESLRFDLQTEDRSGGGARPCFFDQTFFINDAYEKLKTPENLIYISEDNFGTNLEQASDEEKELFSKEIEGSLRWCIRNTAAIPADLVMEVPVPAELSAERICRKYGISNENCSTFIKSIYHRLFATDTKANIFVKTDGSIGMMKDLLYLFLSIIPYSVRVKVSSGEYCYEGQKGNDIYFTDRIPEHQMFVDPVSGNENVFTGTTKARFDERYPFVSFAMSLDPHDRISYFNDLEMLLENLGLGRADNWQRQHLLMAHVLLTESKNPEDLISAMYGLLKYPVSHNEYWENCLASLMNAVVHNNIKLSEEMEKLLLDAAMNKTSGPFFEAVLSYEAANLVNQDTEKALAGLNVLSSDKEQFLNIMGKLSATVKGRSLLHEFYLRKINALKDSPDDQSNRISLANAVRSIKGNEDLLDLIAEIELGDAIKQLDSKKKTFSVVSRELAETTHVIYGKYDGPRNRTSKGLRDRYHHILMSNISDELINEGDFKQFYKQYGKEYPDGIRFLHALHALNSKNYEGLEEYMQSQLPERYKERICKFLASKIRRNEVDDSQYAPLRIWLALAKCAQIVPATLMIDNKAKLLFDYSILDQDLDKEAELWSDHLLAQTIEVVKERMKQDQKLKKRLKDSLEILKVETELRRKNKGGIISKLFGR